MNVVSGSLREILMRGKYHRGSCRASPIAATYVTLSAVCPHGEARNSAPKLFNLKLR
jgi:hypothetical protein